MAALFLIATIAGRTVAIGSDQVESVVDIGAITPVPGTDDRVRGLAALRSRVMTVIDTCAALALPDTNTCETRAVITHVEGHHYAILVESVEDVAPFALTPLSSGVVLDHGWRTVGYGVVERGGEPILAIDLHALIPGLVAAA